jgi:hypothetical protein
MEQRFISFLFKISLSSAFIEEPYRRRNGFSESDTKPLGHYYHNFIRAYGNIDRGLKESLNLLLYIKEDGQYS